MSHFSVGVLLKKGGKELEQLLAPYQENNMGDCPVEYLEFEDCTKEVLENYEEHKEEYTDVDTFAKDYYGYKKHEDKYGYWENPNAKWDWYLIGGRWSESLIDKKGKKVSFALLKDIDWDKMREQAKKVAEYMWDNTPEGIERFFAGITKEDTRESFIKRQTEFSTYAVVTPDGVWHSKGTMGWFGLSKENDNAANTWSNNFYDTFIKNEDQETMLVIVDCHI
ncbi:hypothetical protein U729_3094 (plasmid) [Clostridium baratii str. Sullivan]|uniref:Uncharacterized protein n=1 Tax=Clostridium baratii str. Sullivan TaxID=1415775 RepID=A0A0A7G098_9CLOT|nr:hypothetical protein [Clostridium baratii]AIY85262.1 hypothetical protein U729_3094 [Clostridium baratii str. Sullivan]